MAFKHLQFSLVATKTLSMSCKDIVFSDNTVKSEVNFLLNIVAKIKSMLEFSLSKIELDEVFYNTNFYKLEKEIKISALKSGLSNQELKKNNKLKLKNCGKFMKLSILSVFSSSGVLSSVCISTGVSPKESIDSEVNYLKLSASTVKLCLSKASLLKEISEVISFNALNPLTVGNITNIFSDSNLSYKHKGNENIFKNA